jgi:hypothetical protein
MRLLDFAETNNEMRFMYRKKERMKKTERQKDKKKDY